MTFAPVLADIGDLFGELAIYIAWAVLIFGSALFRLLRKLLGLGDEAAEQLQRAREARRAAAQADPTAAPPAQTPADAWRELFSDPRSAAEPELEPEPEPQALPPAQPVRSVPLSQRVQRVPLSGLQSTLTSDSVPTLEERLERGGADAGDLPSLREPRLATPGLGGLEELDEPSFEPLAEFEHDDGYELSADEVGRLGDLTIDRGALRRAVLWSEILGRPVALRSPDVAAGPPGLTA